RLRGDRNNPRIFRSSQKWTQPGKKLDYAKIVQSDNPRRRQVPASARDRDDSVNRTTGELFDRGDRPCTPGRRREIGVDLSLLQVDPDDSRVRVAQKTSGRGADAV